MDPSEFQSILKLHNDWLNGEKNGKRAILIGENLSKMDLSEIDLSKADLSGANLSEANLSRSDLSEVNLSGANLTKANLYAAELKEANLLQVSATSANFSWANLYKANFSYSCLFKANFSNANLANSDFYEAVLAEVNFCDANLNKCDFTNADLCWANICTSNFNDVIGLIDPIEFLSNFEKTDEGIIVYKTFNQFFPIPEYWTIEPGQIISEVVNPTRTILCGSGINVGSLEWAEENSDKDIWKCLIRWEWLPGVVVPFNTTGSFRCSRLQLIEKIKK